MSATEVNSTAERYQTHVRLILAENILSKAEVDTKHDITDANDHHAYIQQKTLACDALRFAVLLARCCELTGL